MKTEVKFAHPPEIIEWRHDPLERFLNAPVNSSLSYELGITKPDIFNRSFHFSVRVVMIYLHKFNGEVFKGVTQSNYYIGFDKDAPTIEFLFDLIKRATEEFTDIFQTKVNETNLRFHQIQPPSVDKISSSLQPIIDYWDSEAIRFKKNGGERLERFKNLPSIPVHKVYGDHHLTNEQMILRKLETGQYTSPEEREIFDQLGTFYEKLNRQLAVLDYTSFVDRDVLNFRNYISYAFNALSLITNEITIAGELYRVIINESVSGKDESITQTKYLTYPPLATVKNNKKYNRASLDIPLK